MCVMNELCHDKERQGLVQVAHVAHVAHAAHVAHVAHVAHINTTAH